MTLLGAVDYESRHRAGRPRARRRPRASVRLCLKWPKCCLGQDSAVILKRARRAGVNAVLAGIDPAVLGADGNEAALAVPPQTQ